MGGNRILVIFLKEEEETPVPQGIKQQGRQQEYGTQEEALTKC